MIRAFDSGQRRWFASACVMHARQYVWPEPRSDTGSTNGSAQMEQHMLSSSAFEYSAFRRWRFVGRAAVGSIFTLFVRAAINALVELEFKRVSREKLTQLLSALTPWYQTRRASALMTRAPS